MNVRNFVEPCVVLYLPLFMRWDFFDETAARTPGVVFQAAPRANYIGSAVGLFWYEPH